MIILKIILTILVSVSYVSGNALLIMTAWNLGVGHWFAVPTLSFVVAIIVSIILNIALQTKLSFSMSVVGLKND